MYSISPDHEKIIYRASWSFFRTTGVDLEELKSEGNLLFCKAKKTHNPKKGEFLWYFRTVLYNGLKTFCKNQIFHHHVNHHKSALGIEETKDRDQYQDFEFQEQFKKHPEPIIGVIFDMLVEETITQKKGQGKQSKPGGGTQKKGQGKQGKVLYGWLDKKLNAQGFKYKEIWWAFKEIKNILKG